MYLRVLRPDVKQYTRREPLRVLLQLGTHGMDGLARNRYRKTDLTLFDKERQI